jgi:NAD(P)-dependent dehydrogenase (short-subunit alcohol dehydrogenase family)
MSGYGLSKALLACYTMLLAKEHPEWVVSCITPGFIDTKLTAGMGATKTPEEGTVSIKHCLFEQLQGSGWFYGSDAVRSPLHFLRNPGEPAYDGVPPP